MKLVNRWLLPGLLVLGTSNSALAHISLETGGTHQSRYGDQVIKQGPCGAKDGKRGENVYTYKAGETIHVALTEYIPHPGYFRFSFDDDGDDDFVDPQSIKPLYRECMDDPKDHCGEDDFYNNPTVLEGMDNLDPHQADYSQKKKWEWDVKLPDVACDNCTLQVIQVMEDPYPIHAPFTPGEEDIYYQCIDLVLTKDEAPAGSGGSSGETGSGGSKATPEPASDDDGCTIAHGQKGYGRAAPFLFALGAAALVRRRSRRSR